MSKNFELLRQASGQAEILPPPEPRGQAYPMGRLVYDRPSVLPQPEEDWERISSTLKKHKKLAAGFALATFFAVAIVTFLMRPVYEPVAQLEVDPPGAEVFSMQGNGAAPTDAEYLQTQVQKLKSDELAVGVIRSLQLDRNPEIVPKRKIRKASVVASIQNSSVQLSPLESEALRTFQDRLKVSRDPGSRVIQVAFGTHQPTLSSLVTNKMVDTFIEESYSTRHDAIVKSTQWLSRQLDDVRKKMDESNRALADFQRANGIADTGEDRNTVAEEMADLNRQLTQAQADRIK